MKITHFRCTACGHVFSLRYWSVCTTCPKCQALALIDNNEELAIGLDEEVFTEMMKKGD